MSLNANRNSNIYGSLEKFKEVYSKPFLIRIGSFDDIEPGDFDSTINNRLEERLRDASDVIDSYICGRYDTPVNPAPDWFESCCYKIAIKLLIEGKGYESNTPDENHIEAGKECVKKFETIGTGKLNIPEIDEDTGKSVPEDSIKAEYPNKVFTESYLNKY